MNIEHPRHTFRSNSDVWKSFTSQKIPDYEGEKKRPAVTCHDPRIIVLVFQLNLLMLLILLLRLYVLLVLALMLVLSVPYLDSPQV
jgi:hypothetical protein